MKTGKKWIWIVVGGVVVLFGGGYALSGVIKNSLNTVVKKDNKGYVSDRGDIAVQVVETGPLDAAKTVEIKSRVSGRLAQLLVDEGDLVEQGQLICVIDPQETELRVQQNRAQLKGAQSGVDRLKVEIAQREVTAQTALTKAESRLKQLELETAAQPTLTSTSILSASSAQQSAKQSLDLMVNVTHPNEMVQVRSSLDEARSGRRNADQEYQRQKGLFEKGYVSQREMQNAEYQFSLSEARLTAAQDKFDRLEGEQLLERKQAEERLAQADADLMRAQTSSYQDESKNQALIQAQEDVKNAQIALRDVDAMRATLRQQQASVEQVQSVLSDSLRELGETEVRAPVAGIITKRYMQEGELVSGLSSFSPGSPIVRLENRSSMLVKLQVNEIDVALLNLGTKTEVAVDAFPLETFTGHVSKIAPASVSSTAQAGAGALGSDPVVKFAVEVIVEDISDKLKTGMSATCTMKASEAADVVRVQSEYIAERKDGTKYVLKITEQPAKPGGKVETEEVTVVTGLASGAYTEIIEGIDEGVELEKPDFSGPGRKGFMEVRTGDEEESSGEGDEE